MFSWGKTKHPILALAPMAGYTDSAFRQIVKEISEEVIVFSELTSSDGLFYNSKKTKELLKFTKKEHPIIAQLFGKEPKHFVSGARICEQIGAAGIDINMGCPARKVVNSCHGSALIKNLDLAFKIVEETAKATSLPVSVKTRLGWNSAENLIKFAKGLENAGAKLITVHGRTVKQAFSGKTDFKPIYELKKYLKIPVIGNGDIVDTKTALQKIKNLDGIMVGRAVVGNPWLMGEIAAAFYGKKFTPPKNITEKIPLILKHCKLAIKNKGQHGILEMRKHLVAYIKDIPRAKEYREKLVRAESYEEIERILKSIKNKYAGSQSLSLGTL